MKKIRIITIIAVLLIATTIYPIEKNKAAIETQSIGVSLLENGTIVAKRDYTSSDQGDTTNGVLFDTIDEINNFKIGKRYPYEISVKNSGAIDEYVRVIITKSMSNVEGKKDYAYLDLIEIELSEDDSWIVDEGASTSQRTVVYYKKILNSGETTPNLMNSLKIDNDIMKKSEETIITSNNGYETVSVWQACDGMKFNLSIEVNAVQTHNGEDAIKSAWGADVTIDSDGDISLGADPQGSGSGEVGSDRETGISGGIEPGTGESL